MNKTNIKEKDIPEFKGMQPIIGEIKVVDKDELVEILKKHFNIGGGDVDNIRVVAIDYGAEHNQLIDDSGRPLRLILELKTPHDPAPTLHYGPSWVAGIEDCDKSKVRI